MTFKVISSFEMLSTGCHDTQHGDIHPNDILHDDTQHNDNHHNRKYQQCCTQCRYLANLVKLVVQRVVVLIVGQLSAVMMNATMLSVVMPNAIVLRAVTLNTIMLGVVMESVIVWYQKCVAKYFD